MDIFRYESNHCSAFQEIGKIVSRLEIVSQGKNAVFLHQQRSGGGIFFDATSDKVAKVLRAGECAIDPGNFFENHTALNGYQGKRSLLVGIGGCIGRMDMRNGSNIRTKLINDKMERGFFGWNQVQGIFENGPLKVDQQISLGFHISQRDTAGGDEDPVGIGNPYTDVSPCSMDMAPMERPLRIVGEFLP